MCHSVDFTLAPLQTVESFRGGACESFQVTGDVLLGETVENTSLLHGWTVTWTIVPPYSPEQCSHFTRALGSVAR